MIISALVASLSQRATNIKMLLNIRRVCAYSVSLLEKYNRIVSWEELWLYIFKETNEGKRYRASVLRMLYLTPLYMAATCPALLNPIYIL